MRRHRRALLVVGGFLLAVPLLSGVALAAATVRSGLITVRVEEHRPDGRELLVPVPGFLFEATAALAPWVLPGGALAEMRDELGAYGPALIDTLHRLEELPAFTLVEVRDRDEEVRVRKLDHSLEIEIDTEEVALRISVPLRAVRNTVGWLSDPSRGV